VIYARISVCGVVEYPCAGSCGDWIREHEAIWVMESGKVAVTGGNPYCPACSVAARGITAPAAVLYPESEIRPVSLSGR